MASSEWPLVTAGVSSGSNYNYVYTTSGTTALTMPATYWSAGGTNPVPRPQTALEWLDAEIEGTCKLARLAAV